MTTSGADNGAFDGLARQYWNVWSEILDRSGAQGDREAPAAAALGPAWRQAMDWWLQSMPADAPPQPQHVLGGFGHRSADWFSTMQQVAGQFAGRDTSAEEVASAWRRAVGGQGEHVMPWALGVLGAGVQRGVDPWLREAESTLQRWRQAYPSWLEMPAFGLGRNHQSRWQALARAQQDYQTQAEAYAAQWKTAIDQAFGLFQAKLAAHEEAGRQLTSARALFDLWIEAAEEAYAVVAHSEEFGRVYGAFANAYLRLRGAVQQEVEQVSGRLGIPTRLEVDAAHRRIAELERQVRRLQRAIEEGVQEANDAGRAATGPVKPKPRSRPKVPASGARAPRGGRV